MSKQSHEYITDVRSFLWGLESELIWLELYDTRSVAQRDFSCGTEGRAQTVQAPRAPDCTHRLFQCQRKAGIFSQQLGKLRLVWGISVSAQIRKMETYKFTWQVAQGFADTPGVFSQDTE